MHLIFDTETSGLPKSYTDFTRPDTPRLVTLTAILCDDNLNIVDIYDTIVKPVGFVIPKEASDIHGVTHERARNEGADLFDVLERFKSMLDRTHTLVAHNLSYDLLIMRGEFHRFDLKTKKVPFHYCTKEHSTNRCRIPGKFGKYKWPTLTEACRILINHTFDAHNSYDDTHACLLLYRHLLSLENQAPPAAVEQPS